MHLGELDLGDLHFRLRWSSRRKTLGLTVERDGTLTLAAPPNCPTERLIKFAHEVAPAMIDTIPEAWARFGSAPLRIWSAIDKRFPGANVPYVSELIAIAEERAQRRAGTEPTPGRRVFPLLMGGGKDEEEEGGLEGTGRSSAVAVVSEGGLTPDGKQTQQASSGERGLVVVDGRVGCVSS